jgi:striatin 1/3/4
VTLRAHTAPVTALVHSASRRLLYSASLDATIRVWQLPPASRTTYAPFETNSGIPIATLVGHTDAVWDCALVRNESALVSCGADGTVRVWDVSPAALLPPSSASGILASEGNTGKLVSSWGYAGTDGPFADGSNEKPEIHSITSLTAIRTDLRKVAVAYRNAVVKIFDLETGKETARLPSDVSYGRHLIPIKVLMLAAKAVLPCFRWHRENANKQNYFTPSRPTPYHRP